MTYSLTADVQQNTFCANSHLKIMSAKCGANQGTHDGNEYITPLNQSESAYLFETQSGSELSEAATDNPCCAKAAHSSPILAVLHLVEDGKQKYIHL